MANDISFALARINKGFVVLALILLILGLQVWVAARADGDEGGMEGTRQSSTATKFSFGEPGKAGQVSRTIRITIETMSFAPTSLQVRAGETIRFVVTNTSKLEHEFTIGDVETEREDRAEMAREKGEMEREPNAVLVPAGNSRELLWKFTRAGRIEFDCNVPGHYEAGMRGSITVHA